MEVILTIKPFHIIDYARLECVLLFVSLPLELFHELHGWRRCPDRVRQPIRDLTSIIHKRMTYNIIKRDPLRRIQHKQTIYKRFRLVRYRNVVWEGICIPLDSLIRFLYLSSLKWWPTDQHCIDDHAKRPQINLIGVALLLEDLRGDVVRSAADRVPLLALVLELGGEAEVAGLDDHVLAKEEVAQFDVSVYDHVLV